MVPTNLSASTPVMTWDVVVIGAGPAGALAARQLALAGARTLLVDRCRFPRPKVCGGCVNRHAVALLESVGLQEALGRMGGISLGFWQLQSREGRARVPLGGGIAVSRSRLDAGLVEAACRAGAHFLPQTSAAVLPAGSGRESGFRHVKLSHGGGPAETVRARIVVAADGLGHPSLRQLPEFRPLVADHSRVGLGAMLSDVPDPYARGCVYMAVGTGGYVGLVRLENGLLNVAAALDPLMLKQRGGAAGAVASVLREVGLPPIPDLPAAAWRGTRPLSQHTDPPAGSRVFLVGDAAGYVEPFTGEGIAWAFESAVEVVPLVLDGISAWDSRLAARWRAVHRHRIGRRQRVCRFAIAGLRRPLFIRGLMGIFSHSPALGGFFVKAVNGR